MYCKCTIFTNLVLYVYGCGFKAKFTAKRYSGLKTYHPGILGVKKIQNYQKTHEKYLAIQLTRGKSDKVMYREIWNVDTLRKLLEVKSIKRAIFKAFFHLTFSHLSSHCFIHLLIKRVIFYSVKSIIQCEM